MADTNLNNVQLVGPERQAAMTAIKSRDLESGQAIFDCYCDDGCPHCQLCASGAKCVECPTFPACPACPACLCPTYETAGSAGLWATVAIVLILATATVLISATGRR